ncbi:MFS transporter [Roseovarius atlanticus]|uniref:MFS transporter n=1 Tax=Roseovarius atlanticus TaxID=1641875 RepID=UPI001C979C15|nr:MFS transporter [Roseovarius atlanticus]MBY5989327.1 MFS transporter [Roseovarius atlanticus]MBY6124719.1 MFS transporter [Roseovarius atlanticus]MBY6149214.1 MFS transporter [Roseovarius atlanticus]
MQGTFERLTGQESDKAEARNGLRHIFSLSLTKIADGLIDPKLVLSWLLGVLGAPGSLVALLVPLREAGALLPQVLLAPWLEQRRQRRWMWVAGSAGQGLMAAGIAASAIFLQGWAAGLAICILLAALAVFRAACSVSYKDILGKTVGQTKRGAVTGMAGSVASIAVLVFAGLMLSGLIQTKAAVIAAIALAACLWIAAALIFSTLNEDDSTPQTDTGLHRFRDVIREDANLRRFILVRGLLTATALAPPFLAVMTTQGDDNNLRTLGALLVASAAAGVVSSYAWGWLADRSSRLMLLAAGLLGALAMAAGVAANLAGWAQTTALIPGVLFVLMVAYHGVRQVRSTYLVDISPEDRRTVNSAVANLAIGIILLLAGAFGGALSWVGPNAALIGFAAMSALGGLAALGLRDVT